MDSVRLKIMIVEDDAAHTEAIRRSLDSSGLAVEIAAVETLDQYRKGIGSFQPHIVLMDLNLPDGCALDVLAYPPELGGFPVLIMTSYGNERVAVDAMRAGALDYVVKSPESFAEVPRTLLKALREWKLIRERRRVGEVLRESEERYRRITETITDYIFTVQIEDGQVMQTVHSPTCEVVTGYTPEDFAADPYLWINMVPEEEKDEVLKFARLSLSGRQSSHIEHCIVRKDGRRRWVLNTPVPRFDGQGRLVSCDGVIRDITERKLAEEALKESEERFRLLVEHAPDAIFVQAEGRFVFLNEAAVRLFGAGSETELLGTNVMDRFHPDFKDSVKERIRLLNDEKKTVPRLDEKYLRMDGTESDVEVSAVPFFFKGHNGALVFVRDITEKKRAEREKHLLEEQLRQALKMEAVGQLAGGVAHDLNNLLTPILGYSGLLLEDIHPGDPSRLHLMEIQKAGESAKNLISQLLAFSRRQVLEMKNVNLNKVLAGFEKIIRRTVRENIDILICPRASLGLVYADAGQIEQILMNLAVNAQDAMPDGGALTMRTGSRTIDKAYAGKHPDSRVGRFVWLEVRDTGFGMESSTYARIFEPFFTTKEGGRGTGLGLSTVYGIIKQHDGFIDVSSKPGKGTSFKIYFPRVEGAREEVKALETVQKRMQGVETILVTEDNESVRSLACEILRNHGYTVISAKNGKEGLEILSDHEVHLDLLLADVIMPDINGREMYHQAASIRSGLKVLYMSGYSDDVIAHHGVLDPGIDLINKPFTARELTDKVREVLDRQPNVQ